MDCEYCGCHFMPKNNQMKFCKRTCQKSSWYRRNNESNKRSRIKRLAKKVYKINVEEIDLLYRTCEICGSKKNICIDHCHKTGLVRGGLCQRCNSGIGFFKDDVANLANAINYLNSRNK